MAIHINADLHGQNNMLRPARIHLIVFTCNGKPRVGQRATAGSIVKFEPEGRMLVCALHMKTINIWIRHLGKPINRTIILQEMGAVQGVM